MSIVPSKHLITFLILLVIVFVIGPTSVHSTCKPRLFKCHPPWRTVFISGKETCLYWGGDLVKGRDAVESFCNDNKAKMFTVPDFQTHKYFRENYPNTFTPWMGVRRRKNGGDYFDQDGKKQTFFPDWKPGHPVRHHRCLYYHVEKWTSTPCHVVNQVACLKEKFQEEVEAEKPQLSVKLFGRGSSMYRGSTVAVTCSIVRSVPTNTTFYMFDPYVTLHQETYHPKFYRIVNQVPTGNDLVCAPQTKHTISMKVDSRLDRRQVVCFEEGQERDGCEAKEKTCAVITLNSVVDPPPKPSVTLFGVSDYPNRMYVDEQLEAQCTTHIDPGFTTSWAIFKGGKFTMLHDGKDGVGIQKFDAVLTSTSNIQLKFARMHDGIKLVCFSRHTETTCSQSDYFCQFSSKIVLKERPSPPLLDVAYHTRPANLHLGRDLEARCTSKVGTGGMITWVMERNDKNGKGVKYTLIAAGTRVQRNVGQFSVEIIKHEADGSNITSVLRYPSVDKKFNNIRLVCFAKGIDKSRIECYPLRHPCVKSQTIKTIDGPGPPELLVEFHQPPNTVIFGQPFEAKCRSNVGVGGVITWAVVSSSQNVGLEIARGDQVVTSNDQIKIQIQKHKQDGSEITSTLSVKEIDDRFNNMRLVCFSKELSDSYECTPKDRLCAMTEQIKVEHPETTTTTATTTTTTTMTTTASTTTNALKPDTSETDTNEDGTNIHRKEKPDTHKPGKRKPDKGKPDTDGPQTTESASVKDATEKPATDKPDKEKHDKKKSAKETPDKDHTKKKDPSSNEDLSSPTLSVGFHRLPSTVYLGKELTAKCEVEKGRDVLLTWAVLLNGREYKLLAEGDEVQSGVMGYCVHISENDPDDFKLTSILTHEKIDKNLHGTQFVCCTKNPAQQPPSDVQDPFCKRSAAIIVKNGPQPPKLTITLPIMKWQDVHATCEADVGDDGKLEWSVSVNGSSYAVPSQTMGFFQDTKTVGGEDEKSGNKLISTLTIKEIRPYLNGAVISCFSYPVSQHPARKMTCNTRADENCRSSDPLDIEDKKVEGGINFKFALFPLIALILIVFVLYKCIKHCWRHGIPAMVEKKKKKSSSHKSTTKTESHGSQDTASTLSGFGNASRKSSMKTQFSEDGEDYIE